MVKSRDISVSLTKGDSSPEPQPHLNDSDNDNDQKQQKPRESTLQDEIKPSEVLRGGAKIRKYDLGQKSSESSPVELTLDATQTKYVPAKIPNPFYFRLQLTTVDKVKVALMTMLVFPIRIFLVLLFLFLTWIGCFIGLLGYSEEELESKPIQGWRRCLREAIRTMVFWAYRTFLFRVEIRGERALPSQAPILVAGPHSSFYDFATVIASKPVPSAVIRDETGTVVISTILRFIQPVFVKRSSKESRQTTLAEIKSRATSTEPWSQIVIFPEGTCSNGSVLLKFKQGAFSAGVPVQPVILRYPNRLNTLTWTWDGPSALKTMWLTTCQWKTRMVIEYLPVYQPSEAERTDPALYAYNVRKYMAEALGIGTMEFCFDDLRYLNTGDARQPHHTLAVVKLLKFRAKNGLKHEQLPSDIEHINMLIAKCEADKKAARLSRMEVSTWFGGTLTEAGRELFDALEMESDTFEFRSVDPSEEKDVDLHLLLATLHLANKDGASAFKCLSALGAPAVVPPPAPSSPTAPATVPVPGKIDAAKIDARPDLPKVKHDDESLSTLKLSLPAFCRLCWLAMQMSRREAEQLYQLYQPSPSTLEGLRHFLSHHSDRCKGIAYFEAAQRLDLAPADQPLSGSSSESVDGDLAKNIRTVVPNGKGNTGERVAAVMSNGLSKHQKAD